MAMALASKTKKKSKVDPLNAHETELDDLGSPPSTSDLGELFETESEQATTEHPGSFAAFTEETVLDDSRTNSQAASARSGGEVEETSSRSSTPSSAGGFKRFKRNVVTPIHEETSFGVDNKIYENDESNSAQEAWADTGSSRPNTAPTKNKPEGNLSTPRPESAPMSPRSKIKNNKVTPVSSRSTTPVEKISINNTKRSSIASTKDNATKESPILEEKDAPERRPSTKESKENRKSLESRFEQPQSSVKDAWTIEEELTEKEKSDLPEKALVELDDGHISVQSAEAVLAPPQSAGDHAAYIPIEHAKAYVQKIIEDMKKMKANHYRVVEKIQEQYQLIEDESQAQFNAYVLKLRSEYNVKVSTFRQIIDSHQTEFTNKQKFYEEAIKSLREKNRQLLLQKKEMLIKAKDASVKHEVEKNDILSELTSMLDQKHKEHVILHQKYTDERNSRETAETEREELKRELSDLKSKLELSSGESKKLFDDFDALRKENEELQLKVKEIENERNNIAEEKTKADELCKEKDHVVEEKQKMIEALELQVKQLESQMKELENARVETVTVSTEEIQKSTAELPIVSDNATELEQQIVELRKELEENNQRADEQQQKMKDLTNEKNITKMELLNVQEKNKILHSRLEAMLNEVMDTVNVDHIQVKITELQERKKVIQDETEEINKRIEEWKESYRINHDGQEPTDEEWPDDLHNELKSRKENIAMIDKEITVLCMLLDGTLPDDMKQEDNSEKPLDSISDELRKQYEEKEAMLEKEIDECKNEINILKAKIVELEGREPEKVIETVTAPAAESVSDDSLKSTISELTAALEEAQSRIEGLEAEHLTEIEAQKKSVHKLEKKLAKQESAAENLAAEKRDLESQLKVAKETAQAESNLKQEALDKAKEEIDKLNEEKLAKFPVKAKAEIKALQEKLKQAETVKDGSNQELVDLKSQNASLNEDIANLNITLNDLKEKEAELQKLKQTEKKYSELKKKYKALEAKKVVTKTITTPLNAAATGSAAVAADPEEIKKLQKKIEDLEKQLTDVPAATPGSKKDSKTDPKAVLKLEKANELLKEKVETLKKAAQTDADKMKELQEKLKEAKAAGGDKNSKKQEKTLKDLQKKFETEQKKAAKLKEDLDKTKEETAAMKKEIEALQADAKKDKEEIAKLGVAAKEGIEAAEKVSELSKSNKSLTEENKTLAENFNSERILRKKYYNMVEDMKGKIRVYARARPLSRSELERGNHNILSSPDEYSLIVQTGRGPKDFQYDAVFTPDHSQEKVFEDTNNLIQSAVDGYNVCIFAYGQTGSGKTYTMIGDKEQKSPGIAPRAFQAIYRLIDENKSKFTFQTSMYMLELYRDNLIDLFGDHKNPAKLDVKKDKKGMVVVTGAVVKEAESAEDLMDIFEKGSAARHVASTKMNSESSRSHLVLSIIIESTNKTSGAVVKGKLSLVDLAGSERANKTGATAEQLKEAQSINKSLSALGDVISALSSEQSFIPYRNNKLTLLMQDSLGGNAKTLMFVNISPADYNCDETITSLTYASRVKLITNDASKNSENKEIARLKGIISKLKKGEAVDDEDV